MKAINSYIFLEKERKQTEQKDGKTYIILKTFAPDIFKEIFDVDDDLSSSENKYQDYLETKNEVEDFVYQVTKGVFTINFNDKIYLLNYKFVSSNKTFYLDITANDLSKSECIKFFEEINRIILNNKKMNRFYIPIISYDLVSEYYCNKIFPKLNKFERNFRKLLFITYTSMFAKNYFNKTTSKKFQEKTKKIVGKNNPTYLSIDDYRLQNYFYSLEYGAMNELLFEPRWTEFDNDRIIDFLYENENLSEMTDFELREFIKSLNPKSDWTRFFSSKGIFDSFQSMMNDIGKLRNCVAHNKIFFKDDYDKLNNMLKIYSKEIDRAISITEKQDFKKINMDILNKSTERLTKNIREMGQFILRGVGQTLNDDFFKSINSMGSKITK